MAWRALCIWSVILFASGARAASLEGRVTRSDSDEGVAGAVVLIRGTGFFTSTEADGTYRFDWLPAGRFGSLGLTCAAPGLLSAHTGAVWIESGTQRDFSLAPPPADTSGVHGTVTCAGTPCGGALVRAVRDGNVRGRAVSDASGVYRITGLASGDQPRTYAIEAIAHGHLPGEAEPVSVPPLGDGGTPVDPVRDIDLDPGPAGGYRVTGLVGLSDNPLDRSGSRVYCNGQVPELSTTTDTGGSYVLEGVPAGELSFTAGRDGYRSDTDIDVRVFGDTRRNFVLVLDENGTTDPRFTLSGTVSLTVPDGGSHPGAAGTRVSIWSGDGSYQRSDTTNGDGGYAIGGIDPDRGPFTAGAAREGFTRQTEGPFDMSGNRTLDFTLVADPEHDWGPGAGEDLSGCGCRPAATAGSPQDDAGYGWPCWLAVLWIGIRRARTWIG